MRLVPLGDLLELSDSGVWGAEDPAGGMSVLRSTNFNANGTLDLSKLTFRALEERSRTAKLIRKGDILLEKSGGGPKQPVGRVCLFKGDSRSHSFGNFIARLRPTNDVVSEYLFYFLWHFHSVGLTSHYQKQTTGIRNLEFKRYLGIHVPLVDLEDQKRISAILSRAARIVQLRCDAYATAQAVLPALFLDMFGDPLTNPRGWPMRPVRELVARFEGGKNLQAGSEGSTDFRILKVSAVTKGDYIESESKPTPEQYVPPQGHVVRVGDMLFSRANTEELVGATALVEATNGRSLLPDKLWRFVWSEPVEQRYMHALFQNAHVRRQLAGLSSGTSSSMRNISQAKLFDLHLPVAPLAQQAVFARHADALKAVMVQQTAAMDRAKATFDSLLSRAFVHEADMATGGDVMGSAEQQTAVA